MVIYKCKLTEYIEGMLNPKMKRLVMAGQIHTDNTKVGPGTYNIL